MAIRIYIVERIIPNIAVFVKSLRITYVCIRKWTGLADLFPREWIYDAALKLIGAQEPALRSAVVPGKEEVQSRLGIPFFAGELGWEVKLCANEPEPDSIISAGIAS